MKRVLLMILAVGLLAVYANAATVTITLDQAAGKYFITAQTDGAYGIAGFKVTGNSGDFAGATNVSPVVHPRDTYYAENPDYAWSGFSLLRVGTLDAVVEGAQDTVATIDQYDNTTGIPILYSIYTMPVLDYKIGVEAHNLANDAIAKLFDRNSDTYVVDDPSLAEVAANVVLLNNIAAKPTLKIGDTLETLAPMTNGTTYAAGKLGTLANVFINNTDNQTEAASIKFVDATAPVGIPGDFNNDGVVDVLDINLLFAAINAGSTDLLYDVTGDGLVNQEDADYWVRTIKLSQYGDANLDGFVDELDLTSLTDNWYLPDGSAPCWELGDFTGDGYVDELDLTLIVDNWYFGY